LARLKVSMTLPSDPETLDVQRAASRRARTFAARLSVVPEITRFVEAFCAAHDVHRDDRLRLALIVEELVSNTIVHGHGGDSDSPICVVLAVAPAAITLQYEDSAPMFDVAAALPTAQDAADVEFDERPVGNVGLRLLAHYSNDVRYVRDGERNRITLSLARRH
jgi:serine/threonine-protein kinase RsbW